MSKMLNNLNGVEINELTEISYSANKKRPSGKAYARYELYSKATTIGEYYEIADPKYATADLKYDHEHGFLTLVDEDQAEAA